MLWWQIHRLVDANRPPIVLLENVDRLLKSPANQRGRDFAVMLASLGDLGYSVEWRVINAAEYGFPQRRKRVFIVARHEEAFPMAKAFHPGEYLAVTGVLARAFPVEKPEDESEPRKIILQGDLADVSQEFNRGGQTGPFANAGVLVGRDVYTQALVAQEPSEKVTLGDVLLDEKDVPEAFFVPEAQLESWERLKGAKQVERTHAASGETYKYSEGKMAFPDLLENPARTILTGEGGTSPSRFKHIVKTQSGRYRRLVPVELERLSGFPDGWTRWRSEGVELPDSRRAFFVGNALVVGVVERNGSVLASDWQEAQSRIR